MAAFGPLIECGRRTNRFVLPNWLWHSRWYQYDKLDQIGPKLVDDGLLHVSSSANETGRSEADRPPNADIISTYNLLIESLIEYTNWSAPIRLSEAAQHTETKSRTHTSVRVAPPGLSDGCEPHAGKMARSSPGCS